MTQNAQHAIDELSAFIPTMLEKYMDNVSQIWDFQSIVKAQESRKVLQIIAGNCETIQDIKDIYLWINATLPNWWGQQPFSNNHQEQM